MCALVAKLTLLTLLCLIRVTPLFCEDETTTPKPSQAWTNTGTTVGIVRDVYTAIQKQDPKLGFDAFQTFVIKIFPNLTPLSEFASLIFVLAGGKTNDPLAGIKQSLKEIANDLKLITEKVDSIVNDLGHLLVKKDFKDRAQMVKALVPKLQKFVDQPGDKQRLIQFRAGCAVGSTEGHDAMGGIITYLTEEMTETEREDSLVSVYAKNHNLTEFRIQTHAVMATFVQASVLRVACYGVQFLGFEELEENTAEDVEEMNGQSLKIREAVARIGQDITTNFARYAKEDAKRLLKEKDGDLAERVYNHLTYKYQWRKWYVADYNRHFTGEDLHLVKYDNTTVFVLGDGDERRLIASSTTRPDEESGKLLAEKTNACLGVGTDWGNMVSVQNLLGRSRGGVCKSLISHLEKCLKGVPYGLLGCVAKRQSYMGYMPLRETGEGRFVRTITVYDPSTCLGCKVPIQIWDESVAWAGYKRFWIVATAP